MPAQTWNDETLIQAIQGTQKERDAALLHIFQHLDWQQMTGRFVVQNSGDTHDAADVFQEAIIQLDKNLRKGKFEGRSALQTYFFAIVKFIWWKKLERRRSTEEIKPQHHDGVEESPEVNMISEEKRSYLREAMGKIGARCKEILQLYQLNHSMDEIAQAIGLGGPEMAKKEAYRCRMRLRQFFEQNRLWKTLVS